MAVCRAVVIVLVFPGCLDVMVGASKDGTVNSLSFAVMSHMAYFTTSVALGSNPLVR